MDTDVLQRHAPLHEQLLHILKNRIARGDYQRGDEFPSERELATEFNVSRATIRSAVSSLAAEGLLIRRRGVGSYVSPLAQITNPINEVWDFTRLIASGGFEPGVEVREATLVEAGEELARSLSVDVGSRLLRLNKVFSADGEPLIYVETLIPELMVADCLAAVLENPDITEPMFAFLEDRCGQRVENAISTFWPDTVRDCGMDIGDFDPGTPVLMMDYIAYSNEGTPIWHSLQSYIGGRMKFNLIRRRS
jgi:GntR family transcriptional regulator